MYRWGVLLAGVTALAVAFVCVCAQTVTRLVTRFEKPSNLIESL